MGESLMMLFRLYEALHQAEPAQACRAELRALAESAYAPLHLALDPDSSLRPILLACL